MYVDRVQMRDVKCFADVEIELQSTTKAKTKDRQTNWNVILGENGDGKTSLLQGIAACLMDATTADRMLRPDGWVRRGAKFGSLGATLVRHDTDHAPAPHAPKTPDYPVQYHVLNAGEGPQQQYRSTGAIIVPDTLARGQGVDDFEKALRTIDYLARNAFSRQNSRGWFSAGYGPYRRLAASRDAAPTEDALAARFATLFEESAALVDCEAWLKEMERRAMKAGKASRRRDMLDEIKKTIAKLLPEVEEVSIEDDVCFVVRGKKARVSHLSHGYRSMFALAVDILRYMEFTSPNLPHVALNELPGVVLIDEIDAHLHPRWQRQIGFWLCEAFPNLQFIVTSHSPFVAMAAAPGGLTVLKRDADDGSVTADQEVPYVRGWAVDEVLSQLFGQGSLRDPKTEEALARYETLRTLNLAGTIGPHQKNELRKLEAYLDERLRGEPASPKNQRIDEDMKLIAASLAKRNGKRKHA